MKNKDIINVIFFMLILLVIIVLYYFRYNSSKLNDNIMNKTWYRYDYKTGYYERIVFSKNAINYYRPIKENETNEYDKCKKYNYNKKNSTLELDCGLKIKYIDYNNNKLTLKINGNDRFFFLSIDDSLNNEFENYYGKSIFDYKKEKTQAKNLIKINESKLFEIIKSDEYSKIVFIGDKCSSIDCILTLDIMEKWISSTENVYFFDVSELKLESVKKLNIIDNELENKIEYYNNIYPKVLISKNNKIIDKYDINCNGFNCKEYFNNEF